MTMKMNVRLLVIPDITLTKKQRHVIHVMVLVHAVKDMDQKHVLVVMEP